MHTLAHERLDRFQIDATRFAAVGEDLPDQTLYFAGRLLLDGFERFFSCSDKVSGSDGRE